MNTILDTIMGQLPGGAATEIAGKIGADPSATAKALSAALPLLVTALARNASSPQGAQSLHQALKNDHDGGILDDVMGFLGGSASSRAANGAGILKHVLGAQQPVVQQGISKASGLDTGSVATLLQLAAPLVMGALGKATQQQGLDANGLSQFLGGQQEAVRQQAPDMMGMLGSLLDQNNDGSVVDDVFRMAGKLFGGNR